MSVLDEMLGVGKTKDAPTLERIADAAELTAAVAALQFYRERNESGAAAERLGALVKLFTARLCKRHGV